MRKQGTEGRTMAAGFVLVLASLVTLAAVPAVWASTQLGTERYHQLVGSLDDNPQLRELVVQRAAAAALRDLEPGERLDQTLDQLESAGLPSSLTEDVRAALRPLRAGATALAEKRIRDALASETGERTWRAVLDVVRNAVVEPDPKGGTAPVTVDVAPLIREVQGRLADDGLPLADVSTPDEVPITLLRSEAVEPARDAYRGLEPLALVLAAVAGVLVVAGIALSPRRWQAVTLAGVGVAVAMGVLLAGLAWGREPLVSRAVDASGEAESAPAVRALYDALAASIQGYALGVLAVAFAAVALTALVTTASSQRYED